MQEWVYGTGKRMVWTCMLCYKWIPHFFDNCTVNAVLSVNWKLSEKSTWMILWINHGTGCSFLLAMLSVSASRKTPMPGCGDSTPGSRSEMMPSNSGTSYTSGHMVHSYEQLSTSPLSARLVTVNAISIAVRNLKCAQLPKRTQRIPTTTKTQTLKSVNCGYRITLFWTSSVDAVRKN